MECSREGISLSNGIPFGLRVASAHMAQGYPELAAHYINQPEGSRLDHPERQTMAADPAAEREGTLEMLPLLDTLEKNGTLRHSEHRSLELVCRRYATMLFDHIANSKEPRLDDDEKLARRQALDDFFGKIELAAGIDTAGTFCESRECGGCPHAEDPIGDLPCKDYLDWLLTLAAVPLVGDVGDVSLELEAMTAAFHEWEKEPRGWVRLNGAIAETILIAFTNMQASLDACRKANDEGTALLTEAQAEVQELTSQIKIMDVKAEDVSKELLGSEEYLEGIVDEVHAVIGEHLNATDTIQKIREIFRRERYPW